MTDLQILAAKLSSFIAMQNEKSHEEIASYIVGELIGDSAGKYQGFEDQNVTVARIADLASDLEWSNGSDQELELAWNELVAAIGSLSSEKV